MKVPKVFIETSVFLRFLTKDDPIKYQSCEKLFELISQGKIRPYISNIVIMEVIFILTRQYKFNKNKVIDAISKILLLRNITLIEKTDSKLALNYFRKYKIKYGDCLIISQLPHKTTLISYDTEFNKIKAVTAKTPQDL